MSIIYDFNKLNYDGMHAAVMLTAIMIYPDGTIIQVRKRHCMKYVQPPYYNLHKRNKLYDPFSQGNQTIHS